VLDNDETKLNKLNEQNNHIKWKDPNPFTNYQIYHSVVTDETNNNSTGNTGGNNTTGQ
ncbi:LytR family transcriptional regulator, partial [Lactobacillus sp. R2/2]|nr:LytR family transcriptional regulator [Lactobacillus sp. R2/2]